MSILHSKNRRPEPLQPADYDHEISLVDSSNSDPEEQTGSQSEGENRAESPGVASDSSSRRNSDVPLRGGLRTHGSLRKKLTQKKFAKYQDRHLEDPAYNGDANGGDAQQVERTFPSDEAQASGSDGANEDRGRKKEPEPESAIDILFENQRGLFLCGIPLFSSKALGNLDPAPWTTIYKKKSFTDIHTHQVPDPTWEWKWPEWRVNHDSCGEEDDDGWEYSFAFSKKFSWHRKTWWNSYVRRRAWTRKRVKKPEFHNVHESHMLTEDYFTIHSALARSHSPGSSTAAGKRKSFAQQEIEAEAEREDIRDIGALLKILRFSRIDREKMEAVENFITHGGDELYYLKTHMHEIMKLFIFQASRRILLAHLIRMLDEAATKTEEGIESASGDEEKQKNERRLRDLEQAVKAADEEVKRLEYWSDIKSMAEKGQTKGAMDSKQGWGESWRGIDGSGPRDVANDLPGIDACDGPHERDGDTIPPATPNGKGKEKATE